MVYHDTRRQLWSGGTAVRFFCTSLVLGAGGSPLFAPLQGLLTPAVAGYGPTGVNRLAYGHTVGRQCGQAECRCRCASAFADTSGVRKEIHCEVAWIGELSEMATARVLFGFIGGAALPLAFLGPGSFAGFRHAGGDSLDHIVYRIGIISGGFLFFVAVARPECPAALAT